MYFTLLNCKFQNMVKMRASLVAQGLRIHLPMLETEVRIPGLGRSHMPWSSKACAPQLFSLCSRAQEPQLLKPESPRVCAPKQESSLHSQQLEKSLRSAAKKTQHSHQNNRNNKNPSSSLNRGRRLQP